MKAITSAVRQQRKAVLEIGALFANPCSGDRQDELQARKASKILNHYGIPVSSLQEDAVLDVAEGVSELLQKVGVAA